MTSKRAADRPAQRSALPEPATDEAVLEGADVAAAPATASCITASSAPSDAGAAGEELVHKRAVGCASGCKPVGHCVVACLGQQLAFERVFDDGVESGLVLSSTLRPCLRRC